jgi:hypothetical protein
MTKRRNQVLKQKLFNFTQALEQKSQQYVLDNPLIPLTFIFGNPPNSIKRQYYAPHELVKDHLNDSPQEIMSTIPWEFLDQKNLSNEKRIESDFLGLLLLCPSSEEIDEYRRFLRDDKARFSMLKKLNWLQNDFLEEKKIQTNLKKLAVSDFQKMIEEWKETKKLKRSVSEITVKVLQQPFAPEETDTLDIAYEKLLMARKLKNLQYFSLLMDSWKHHLRKTIFEDCCWPITKQQYFFEVWERLLFKKSSPPLIPMKMRWEQAQSIDRLTGGKLIKYFNDLFISDENPIYGQVACILWTLIAISWQFQSNEAPVKLIDVVGLSKSDVNIKNRSLCLNGEEITVSKGLTAIYAVLIDVKYGKRQHRLFPDMTVDRLEDALKGASKNVFVDKDVLITPQAFLTFPHPFEGVRIAPKLLQGMCDESAYKSKPEDRIGIILRPFKLPIHR